MPQSSKGTGKPQKMRAARHHGTGDLFQVDIVETPSARATDVVVQVKACGLVPNTVNSLKPNKFIRGLAHPATFGLDAAGVIVEVGELVYDFAVGDRVYVNPLRYCGSCIYCRKGHVQACDYATLNGYFGTGPKSERMLLDYPQGGYAEYLAAPQYSLVRLPDSVSFETASRWGYLGTAYSGLRAGGVDMSTTTLINGATGTLGLGTTLFALALGAPQVLAVGRDAPRLERLKALAPERISVLATRDYATIESWARDVTSGVGADVVIDALPGSAAPEAFTGAAAALARGGTHVNIGGLLVDVLVTPAKIMTSAQSYVGSFWFTTREAQEMASLVASGTVCLDTLEHIVYPLEELNTALRDVADGNRDGGFSNYVICP